MPLETGQYLSDLNPNNPVVTDPTAQGDDHIRLVKTTLKNTFPNLTGPVLSSQAELDAAAHTGQLEAQDGTAGAPSVTFKNDTTAGFRKGSRTGQTLIEGVLRGNGSKDVGEFATFPKIKSTIGSGGVNTSGPYEYLECDRAIWNIADYPDLGAYLGSTYGGDGTNTFGMPNLKDTGRFIRSRTSSLAAGTLQTNALKSHQHTGTVNSAGDHTHTATDAGHFHNITVPSSTAGSLTQGGLTEGGGQNIWHGSTSSSTAYGNARDDLTTNGNHSHTFSTEFTGDTETRPEAFVAIVCLKT